jgi:hypothetical protein
MIERLVRAVDCDGLLVVTGANPGPLLRPADVEMRKVCGVGPTDFSTYGLRLFEEIAWAMCGGDADTFPLKDQVGRRG